MKSSNHCGCAAELWETASQWWGFCGRRGLVCPYSLERWEVFQGCWNSSWKELSWAAASGFVQRTILVPGLPLGLSWAHSLCSNPVGMAEELLLWHWDVRSPPLWTCSGTMALWDQGLLETCFSSDESSCSSDEVKYMLGIAPLQQEVCRSLW